MPFHKVLKPQTFPRRFNVHKYWGKKPSNVVDQYISYYTQKGDVVLDPFSGSGVVYVESLLLERNAIAFDINPVSKYLSTAFTNKVNESDIWEAFSKIEESVKDKIESLYVTKDKSEIERKVISFVWEEEKMIGVRYIDSNKKTVEQLPTFEDLQRQRMSENLKIEKWIPIENIFQGWQTRKLNAKGITKYSDLFTHRNLYSLSLLFDEIQKIKKEAVRNLLLVAFTSTIAQASKLITNYGKNAGPSWKINTFWIAPNRLELNVWHYFLNRLKKVIAGNNDFNQYYSGSTIGHFYEKTSTEMFMIESNSVDYVFTDPPYGGEGIQYMELSYLWNVWLKHQGEPIQWRDEIAFNEKRERVMTNTDYASGLSRVFAETYRVLKPGAWITVTFANKDIKTWNILTNALSKAGFELKNIVPMLPSAPSITQLNMKDAAKSDLLINLQKPLLARNNQVALSLFNFEYSVDNALHSLEKDHQSITVAKIFDLVTIDWMTNRYGIAYEDASLEVFTKADIVKYVEQKPNYRKLFDEKNSDETRKQLK